ncbi:hypothetical protein AM493_15735 [Flavobacterium akiainvivens]|uniref:Uncharacterized protein n=1 Tax=Flavobacterium akiainvivens TaxID=1202724 RepID=A0A0M9VJ34_9FLAO|nr:hypothetical protein [Flavobacterium akiainvivens]KOS07326.1 hypothetical protein AM493_15735 [Flavobacterium akiainvivens]SFQ46705.1 hypothetical protein SAMN05444144_105128 [Flavobacterium akiainvivens]
MLLNSDILIATGVVLSPLGYILARHLLGKMLFIKKEQVITKHGKLRQQSLHLMESVSQRMVNSHDDSETIGNEVTYADFYRQLKANHVSNLSDKLIVRVKRSNNPLKLEKAAHRLEQQELRLKEAEMMLHYARV